MKTLFHKGVYGTVETVGSLVVRAPDSGPKGLDIYCHQLDRLKLVTDQKWPDLDNRRGVVFHQDNARSHTAVVTRQKLWDLDWNVLMHPPYSPDLAPRDYYLFSHCKTSRVIRNWDEEKIVKISILLEFFTNKSQDFYERGNMKLSLK
ncbi:transposase [Trichonephila clavipes]|nr:transposase [Trichonephila clavipes]